MVDYVCRKTPMPNFTQIRPQGASQQLGEIKAKLLFSKRQLTKDSCWWISEESPRADWSTFDRELLAVQSSYNDSS